MTLLFQVRQRMGRDFIDRLLYTHAGNTFPKGSRKNMKSEPSRGTRRHGGGVIESARGAMRKAQ
ncbi:hypothetical protein AYM40_27320 [Paraburkholderia phytofirmans OLGA172]|uniref:Uncharacterized protein n=1 Tax=Paraburkholderia phytofirmans OLGA172 TaxID=1417228 RepID=A0A160FTJ1_9BURK|nr:hypothetical protein AYM40_27320 [Paraburkholderia phytofirmans OLGA172]